MIPEPDDLTFVLVNGEGVFQRCDEIADQEYVNPINRWWLLDGGNWSKDPVTWEKLCAEAMAIDILEPTERLK